MYTEYTLGAVELAHTSAKLMRYRNTVIQSLKAPTKEEFEDLSAQLPAVHADIQHAVDRYAAASLRVSRSGRSEEADLKALKQAIEMFFTFTNRAQSLMARSWIAGSAEETKSLRNSAELMAASNSGPALIQVSVALDRLLGTVAEVAKDMRDEGTRTVALTSTILIAGSLLIALLNLFLPGPALSPDSRSIASSLQPERKEPSPFSIPLESTDPVLRRDRTIHSDS